MKKILMSTMEFLAMHQKQTILVCLMAAVLFPFVITDQYIMRLAVASLMYVMLSLGLNLVSGYMGQMSFGNAAFWGIGAYAAAITVKNCSLGSIWGFLVAAIVSGLFGFIVGLPVLKLKGYYLTIVTMGFCEIMRLVELNWMEVTNGPMGISGIPRFTFFGISMKGYKAYYFIILILVILTTIFIRRLIGSKFGLALKAIRDDDVVAEAMGTHVVKYKIITFVISAMIAGVAGAFYAQYITFIDPSSFTYSASQEMLIMVIFGGLGSISGSYLGAILLTILPELLRGLMEYRMLIYGVLMVAMMLLKPDGILGNVDFDRLKQVVLQKKRSM